MFIRFNIVTNYDFKNVGINESLDKCNNISPSECNLDLLDIYWILLIIKYYGDYYSDDLNKYIAI